MIAKEINDMMLRVVYRAGDDTPNNSYDKTLIDILTKNVHLYDIEDAAKATRFYINNLATENGDAEKMSVDQFFNQINKVITSLAKNVEFKELAEKVIEWFDFQLTTMAESFEKIKIEFLTKDSNEIIFVAPRPRFDDMAMDAFKFKNCDVQFMMTLSNLIINKSIQVSKKKLDQLINFIDQTMESYGAFLIFFDVWEPSSSMKYDRMLALSDIYYIDYSRGYKLNGEGQKVALVG
jgi:hypothetical protein